MTYQSCGLQEGQEQDTNVGSQFTIIEEVPETAVFFSVEIPKSVTQKEVLASVGFTEEKIIIERRKRKK